MPIIAALIVSAGALLGVFLGAAFATERISAQIEENRVLFEAQLEENRNLQQQQLDSESERLQMQLDAAERRLDRQLKEERFHQDRAELRDTLDSGAELLAQAANKLLDGEIAMGRAQDGDWTLETEGSSRALTTSDRLEMYEALTFFWRRLLLRFKQDDSIPAAFLSAANAYNAAMKSLAAAYAGQDPDLLAAFKEGQDEFRDRYVVFLTQSRRRVGVKDA